MSFTHPTPSSSSADYLFGTQPALEALKSGNEIDKILIQKGLKSEVLGEIISLAKRLNVPFSYVPVEKLNRVTRKNHQGVIMYVSSINYASLDNVLDSAYQKGEAPLILVLDQITDVRNFGAIARTAECAGVHGIVIPSKGGAQINSDAMKTSAGALNYIPICREVYLDKTINFLKESGLQIVGCTEKGDKPVYKCDLTAPTAIIMGSEEKGISPVLLNKCDHKVVIPMVGKVESLNVSVSAGVLVYEVVRQRSL